MAWEPSKTQHKVKETSKEAWESQSIRKAGYLTKLGGGSSTFGRKNWKKRHFDLQNGLLSYAEEAGEAEIGVIVLKGARIDDASDATTCQINISAISPEKRVFVLRAEDKESHLAWFEALQIVIRGLRVKEPTKVLVVVKDGIILLDPKTGARLDAFRLEKLRNWRATNTHFLFCAEVKKEPVNFMYRAGAPGDIARELDAAAAAKAAQIQVGLSKMAAPAVAGVPEKKSTKLPKARVLYDYTAAADNQLSVVRGDTVRLVSKVDQNWTECTNGTGTGLVPASYLRDSGCEVIAKALEDFDDGDLAHLRIDRNDKVIVLGRVGFTTWWEGMVESKAGRRMGIFPLTICEIVKGQETIDAVLDQPQRS